MAELDAQGLIVGSVARVDSGFSVVINRGADDDVKLGMRFQILSKEGEPIYDPDTAQVIETIPYEKARVEVDELYSRAAIASTYGTHFVGGQGGFGSASLASVFGPRREVMDSFEAEVTKPDGQERDLTVRVGDRVRQIPDVAN